MSNVKPLTLKVNDVGKRPLQQPTVKVAANDEKIDNAAEVAAQWIAVAENKEIVAAESFKEFDRVSQWAEDTNVLQMLCEEFLEQCKSSYYLLSYLDNPSAAGFSTCLSPQFFPAKGLYEGRNYSDKN